MTSQESADRVPDTASALAPPLPQTAARPLVWQRLLGSSRGLAAMAMAASQDAPVVVIVPDARAVLRLEREIRFYAGHDDPPPVLPFPDWECLPYDLFSPHQDIVSQRLLTLYRLPHLSRGVVILSVANLMQRLPPQNYIAASTFHLRSGEHLDLEQLRLQLETAGYHCVSQVMEHGEFAVRGGLVDIFPMGSRRPFRIDLYGEEIESIRHFEPDTQRSLAAVDEIRLLPAREIPLDDSGIRMFRQSFREHFEGDPRTISLYRDVSSGLVPAGLDYYFPLFFAATATLFDYLPTSTAFLLLGSITDAAERFEREYEERFGNASADTQRRVLPPDDLFLRTTELDERLTDFRRVSVPDLPSPGDATSAVNLCTKNPPLLPVNLKAESPYARLLEFVRAYRGRILLVAETAGRREAIKGPLNGHGIFPEMFANWDDFLRSDASLGLTVAPIESGLLLVDPDIAVITEPQLFGEQVFQRRQRRRRGRDPEAIIRSLAELKIGDPVVHEDHGVGRYSGLQLLDVLGGESEFLTLEYQGGDKLYIPVLSLHLISRYTGTDPEHAPLHRLGGKEWERATQRARQKAHDAAVELLEVQALRAARKGYAFPERDDAYTAFAAEFPFEETPDQDQAIDEVLRDMESDRPMDRLVCGDVGFGKTEVALRAAFLAVENQRQVAILVPTTLLAQQHYQNFTDRFADLPINIALLSRFRSKSEITKTLSALAQGTVDIIIGTHRLLQTDIKFRDLGLVIIDEEHRFGVRQKERLKKLRSEVDILTLTATPIPRTMNLALAGLRDISIIATPPRERLSVKTFVSEWSGSLIREACLREMRRGGQIYFLHNDVRSMERIAGELEALLPEFEIRIAHGQMPERELEAVMQDFYHQRFNVLLCTTIIESGIDVPTANTIIMNRADRFGLAQLHQLRGRVGRSHHRAYAFLLVPSRQALTADAAKRLEAIAALDELGAGFSLASHDLEIRGAGELLGESQSGLVDEVGFTLYMDLLNRAIASLKAGTIPLHDRDQPPAMTHMEIDLHVPVLIPSDYLPDVHTRLMMYKRIANTNDAEELGELRTEMIDRFGMLPDPATTLFAVTALKQRAMRLRIQKIDIGDSGGSIIFSDQPDIDPTDILRLLEEDPGTYRLDGPARLRITNDLPNVQDRLEFLDGLLQQFERSAL